MNAVLGLDVKSQCEAIALCHLSRPRVAMGTEVRIGEKASRGEAKASPPRKPRQDKWKGELVFQKRCSENH